MGAVVKATEYCADEFVHGEAENGEVTYNPYERRNVQHSDIIETYEIKGDVGSHQPVFNL